MDRLPIEEAIPVLRERLTTGRSVLLTAQPGAGKTTRVPLALLDEHHAEGPLVARRRRPLLPQALEHVAHVPALEGFEGRWSDRHAQ